MYFNLNVQKTKQGKCTRQLKTIHCMPLYALFSYQCFYGNNHRRIAQKLYDNALELADKNSQFYSPLANNLRTCKPENNQ